MDYTYRRWRLTKSDRYYHAMYVLTLGDWTTDSTLALRGRHGMSRVWSGDQYPRLLAITMENYEPEAGEMGALILAVAKALNTD
jgi:hypothetical protein